MLKVMILGGGTMGQLHLQEWSKMNDVQVVGIYGNRKSKLAPLAKTYQIPVFDDMQQMLHDADADVVDICLPTHLHHEAALKAAEAGKHVICEKPLAVNATEAEEIRQALEQKGKTLLVAHVLRYFPEYAQARQIVRDGKLGQIGVVRLSRCAPYPHGSASSWYQDKHKSGGVIFDLMIHDIDWARWTFGDVKRVMAVTSNASENGQTVDYVLAVLKMEDGSIVHIESSWGHTEFFTSMEIAGSQGLYAVDSRDTQSLDVQLHPNPEANEDGSDDHGVAVPDLESGPSPYFKELEQFKNHLLYGEECIVTAEDALQAIKIGEAIHQSTEAGQPVYMRNEVSS